MLWGWPIDYFRTATIHLWCHDLGLGCGGSGPSPYSPLRNRPATAVVLVVLKASQCQTSLLPQAAVSKATTEPARHNIYIKKSMLYSYKKIVEYARPQRGLGDKHVLAGVVCILDASRCKPSGPCFSRKVRDTLQCQTR